MQPRHKALLDKSLQAALAAIELYNKPNFSYREESFSILMINAWELLLKARHLNENNGRLSSLYIKERAKKKNGDRANRLVYKTNRAGNYHTLSINDLLPNAISDENLRIQIETLIQIRDNAIHYMNSTKLFEKEFLGIATASLKSYEMQVQEWFSRSLSDFNLSLIPLTFSVPEVFDVKNLQNASSTHKILLEYLGKQKAKTTENSVHDISLVIDLKFMRNNQGMSVRFDKEGVPVIIDSEESFKNKYPLDFDALKNKLSVRYADFKLNKFFWNLKTTLEKNPKFSGERYLDHTKQIGTKKRYYSSNILTEFDKHYTKKQVAA